MKVSRSVLLLLSGSQGWNRDLAPGLEACSQCLPVRGRGQPLPARTEVLGDGTTGREESLGVA
jgi:hypothetical protein